MNLTLIRYAVLGAAVFGSGFGTAWHWRANEITTMELEAANERISIQRAARATAERQVAAVSQAQDHAQARVAAAAAVADANRTELERLRDATAAAMRAASGSLEACTEHATTEGELLNQCAARLTDVAAKADGHASDVQTLSEAWPQ